MIISINTLRHSMNPFKALLSSETNINFYLGSGTIDMLWIYSDYIDEEYIKKNFKTVSTKSKGLNEYRRLSDALSPNEDKFKYYRQIKKYHIKNNKSAVIYISTNADIIKPIFIKDDDPFLYKIALNPTSFRSMNQVISILEKLIQPNTKRHKIGRIDFSVVLPEKLYPVDHIYKYLYIKNKQLSKRYKSDDIINEEGRVNGFAFGSGNTYLSCYNVRLLKKKLKQSKQKKINQLNEGEVLDKNDYLKLITTDKKTILTRYKDQIINFELQIRYKDVSKRGFNKISDLNKIKAYSPFDNIAFYDFFKIEKNKRNNKFIVYANTVGFQTARSRYNNCYNRNFQRDIGKYIPRLKFSCGLTLNEILNRSFKKGMKKMFKKEN